MEIIKELQQHGLEAVLEKYKLIHKRHNKYPNLVLLRYNQLESPMTEQVSCEARGLILDENNNWAVVSRSYNKFWNDTDGHAAKIDWETAKVYEKLDGSLVVLYWYDNHWNVQTSGTPDASGEVNQTGITFEQLFWDTWNKLGYRLTDHMSVGLCFVFELLTPENRVVVPHSKPRIVLHGVRSVLPTENYQEFNPEGVAKYYGWEICKSYPLQTIEQITEAAKNLNPMECEGYVVRDAQFNRIKIKSPQYVALAHMKDGFSDRRMIELVRTNEGSEFLGYFPEYKDLHNKYLNKYQSLVSCLEESYEKIKHIEGQKDFALEAQKSKCCGALFNLRNNKSKSIKDYLSQISIANLEKVLSDH